MINNNYQKVWNILQDFTEGDKIPSERIIADTLHISRQTVINALCKMENQGHIWRKTKSGWYISPPKFLYDVSLQYTFDTAVKAQGLHGDVTIISVAQIQNPEISNILKTDDITEIQRLKFINNRPVMLEKSFFNTARFPNLAEYDLEKSLTQLLKQHYDFSADSINLQMHSDVLSPDDAKSFYCSEGLPSIVFSRHLSQDNTVLQVDLEIWRFDAITLQLQNSTC